MAKLIDAMRGGTAMYEALIVGDDGEDEQEPAEVPEGVVTDIRDELAARWARSAQDEPDAAHIG